MDQFDNLENNMLNEFAKLLLKLSEDERLVEINRQILAQDLSFDLLLYFQLVLGDNEHSLKKNYLTKEQFDFFLFSILKIVDYNNTSSFLFNIYDSHDHNVLNFEDYCNIFFPRNHPLLCRLMSQRMGNVLFKKIRDNTLYLIRKFFDREFTLVKRFNNYYKRILKNYKESFNIEKIYKIIINKTHFSGINEQLLNNFFNSYINKNFVSSVQINIFEQDDIKAIIRRIDIDRDGIISLDDFNKFFKLFDLIDLNFVKKNLNNVISNSTANIFNKNNLNNTSSISYLKQNNNLNISNISQCDNITELMKFYFLTVMDVEEEIEKAKINLVLKNNFNLQDTFFSFKNYIIDTIHEEKTYIYLDDIIQFIKKFLKNLDVSELDAKLILRRVDLDYNGYIDRAEFFDLISPFEKGYRTLVEKNLKENSGKKSKIIDNECLGLLGKLFELMIFNEKKINAINMHIATNFHNELQNIFYAISGDMNIEYFTYDNLSNYLVKNNYGVPRSKMKLLFIRLDKMRKGKIELSQFLNEFTIIN